VYGKKDRPLFVNDFKVGLIKKINPSNCPFDEIRQALYDIGDRNRYSVFRKNCSIDGTRQYSIPGRSGDKWVVRLLFLYNRSFLILSLKNTNYKYGNPALYVTIQSDE
jgi:hypothetical protein